MYEARGHISPSSRELQGRAARLLSSPTGSRSLAATLTLPLFGQPRLGAYVTDTDPRTEKRTAFNYWGTSAMGCVFV